MAQQIRIDRRFAIIDEWVLDLPVSDRAIRLYAILARYADHNTHKAFPSRRTLSERLRCSMKSVDRAVQELVDCRALSKEQRFNSSLVFTLNTVWTDESRGVDSGDQGGWTPVTRGVDTGDDLTRTTKQDPDEQELLNKQFDQFWSVYPIKKDKALARRSFEKALKRATAETIIEGAIRHRDDPNREDKYTKNPSTWLNADAWENPPELPRNTTRQKPMTNNEQAALLAMQYRQQAKELESAGNDDVAQEIELEATNWLKGTDDL